MFSVQHTMNPMVDKQWRTADMASSCSGQYCMGDLLIGNSTRAIAFLVGEGLEIG